MFLAGLPHTALAASADELAGQAQDALAAGDTDKALTLAINVLAQASWVLGTALGVLVGDALAGASSESDVSAEQAVAVRTVPARARAGRTRMPRR